MPESITPNAPAKLLLAGQALPMRQGLPMRALAADPAIHSGTLAPASARMAAA